MPLPFLLIGAALLVALIAWPEWGLRARWARSRQWADRVRCEDALKYLLKAEVAGETTTLMSVAGVVHLRPGPTAQLLAEMERGGLISHDQGRLRLRSPGRKLALHVIRAHRLWESYLADQTGTAAPEWHPQAEAKEHRLSPQQANALAARLGHPRRDPHGDIIPEVPDDLAVESGRPLTAAPLNTDLRVTHVEDEPESIYAKLNARGIQPGCSGRLLERSDQWVRFRTEDVEHRLAPIEAQNISVLPLERRPQASPRPVASLAELRPGQVGLVAELSSACHGPERRRLLDLGFVPGTPVTNDLVSPAGDPVAYRVRGTLVALRREQARFIRIAPPSSTTP